MTVETPIPDDIMQASITASPASQTSVNATPGIKGFARVDICLRFWSKVTVKGDRECWDWTGAHDGRGRGQIWVNGRSRRAPQIAWEIHYGTQFPNGLVACHTCDNPNCVNPAHIWAGSMSENIRDCVSKGRHKAPIPQRQNKSSCVNGHAFSDDNTYVNALGKNVCRTCMQAARLRYSDKSRARAALKGGE